ncbi:MAG: hypothetical protein ABIP52_08900 [Cyclobacteriaceae bacterium]
MENQIQRPNNSDEVDLTQFFRWVGRGFSRIGNSIIYGLASLRNQFFYNRLFFLGIIILGLILGGIYSELLNRKYYKSTMVLSCDYLNTQILKNTIDKFNLLAGERDTEGLQEVLSLDANTAKNLQKFEFRSFVSEDDVVEMEVLREQLNNVTAEKKDLVEKVIDRLEIENKNAYEISVLVYDPGIVRPLEKALVSYFSNNNYIKRRIEINKQNLTSRKIRLERDLRKLDSLKVLLFSNYQLLAQKSRGSNNIILNDETIVNPLEVFTKDLQLHEELQDVNKDLYLRPDFEIVDGFTTFKEPESASLVETLFIAFFISILMGYLILGAWRFDRMLASYPTQKGAIRN